MTYNPAHKLQLRIELYINGAWVDVTTRGRAAGGISIKAARSPGAIQAETSLMQCTIGNADGWLTDGNPMSPWWPYVRPGCPIRQSVVGVAVLPGVRFQGQIAQLVGNYPGGPDSTVLVTSIGRLGVIGLSAEPLDPTQVRTILADSPVAYWRLEDPVGTMEAASALPGYTGPALRVYDTVEWRAVDTGPGGAGSLMAPQIASELPLLNMLFLARGSTNFACPWTLEVSVKRPSDGSADGDTWLNIGFDPASSTNGAYVGLFEDTDSSPRDWYHYLVTGEESGGNYEIKIWRNGLPQSGQTGTGSADILELQVGPFYSTTPVGFSHLAIYAGVGIDPVAHSDALQAYAGEQAHVRIARLLAEAGLTSDVVGSSSAAMGPQLPGTLLDLLTDCEVTDGGLLHDSGATADASYVCRSSLCNQAVAVAVTDGALEKDLQPIWDNQLVRNDVTSTMPDGTTARVVDEDHIEQVGARIKDKPPVNIEDSALLPLDAAWRVHVSTPLDPRYDSLGINLRNSHGALLANDILEFTPGQRMTVAEAALPDQHPPRGIDSLVLGWTEELDAYEWLWRPVAIPAQSYQVAVIAGTGAPTSPRWRLDCSSSTLNSSATATATSLSIATASGPLLSTSGADYPADIEIEGIRITVTAVSGGSSPQTATVLRSTDGFDKALSSGAEVRLWRPPAIAL